MTHFPCTLDSVYPYSGGAYNGAAFAIVAEYEGKRFAIDTLPAAYGDRRDKLRAMYPAARVEVISMNDSRARALIVHGTARDFHNAAASEWVAVQVPFSGFYNSHHDSAIDDALSFAFQDSSGCGVHGGLQSSAWDAIEWRAVWLAYGQAYAYDWAGEAGVESLQFGRMYHPREYNFETDGIDARISLEEARHIFENIDREALSRIAKERLSPRSGFIPFYSTDVESWGDVETWEPPLMGILLAAQWETENSETWEESDFETYYGGELNSAGALDSMLFAEHSDPSGKAARAANVASYLRQREERGDGYEKSAAAFADSRW